MKCFQYLCCCACALGLLAATGTIAQTAPATTRPASSATVPQNATTPAVAQPIDQKIERIRIEDAGARIDELRVGGQTVYIEVQPAGNMPAYQISPAYNGSDGPAQRDAPASAKGVRTWKIFSF